MDAIKKTSLAIFHQPVKYVVPKYQRNYVWNQENQWAPLWDDIVAVTDRMLESDGQIEPHFLGTLITKEIRQIDGVYNWVVVDGQQRLTTLQLALAGLGHVMRTCDYPDMSKQLDGLIVNSKYWIKNDYDRFKVEPKGQDYSNFQRVIDGARRNNLGQAFDKMAECCQYFISRCEDWLQQYSGQSRRKRAETLVGAVQFKLQFVEIQLSRDDNPHRIFESLNARGVALTEYEKTKNYWLSIATELGDNDGTKYYPKYLEVFDTDPYWSGDVSFSWFSGQRVDLFLRYWAQTEIPKKVSATDTYRLLRRVGEKSGHGYRDVDGLFTNTMDRFMSQSAIFEDINRERNFSYTSLLILQRRRLLRISSLVPLIMKIVDRVGRDEMFEQCMTIFDSYMMRKIAINSYFSAMDDVVNSLLAEMNKVSDADIPALVLGRFGALKGGNRWPDDTEIRREFVEKKIYGVASGEKIRLVLDSIASRMQRVDDTVQWRPLENLPSITIEHVIPQEWSKHWKSQGFGADEVEKYRLGRIVNRYGNLTIVTQSLNSSMGNKSWGHKRARLADDGLEMNRDIPKSVTENAEWDEDRINERGARLAELVVEIWPHVDTLAEKFGIS